MTDDEAFVRAIVAAPTDEAPRLVYADWLDESGDPRGAYLRAELEWARKRLVAGGSRVRAAAKGLDPVWLARVSRPPVGVCVGRLPLTGRGPPVGPTQLDAAEARYELQFPAEYRAFLLNYNGGGFDVPRGRGQAGRALRFHRLLDPWRLPPYRGRVAAFRRPWADLRTMIHVYRHDYFRMTDSEEIDRVWTNFLPVAHAAEPDVWDIFLGLSIRRPGRVYEFDYLHGACPRAMKTVAPSLGRFLHRCERLIGSR